jgi:hypothetical protein
MNKLSTLWSNAIAYVALLTGSGLSVAGNVADTFRTRGEATDGLDIILAGAWPILVILTIEMFVSGKWSPRTGFQGLRWAGCLAIGGLAMLVSWLHLHDLFISRGQLPLVATAGPLAIDCMAIMATGLILSTRGRVAKDETWPLSGPQDITDYVPASVHDLTDGWTFQGMDGAETRAATLSRLDDEDEASLARLDASLEPGGWLARLTDEMDSSVAPVSAVPVSPAPRSNEVKPESVPADAADLIMAWMQGGLHRPSAGDVDMLLAAEFGRQPRTIRRWRDALKTL